MRCVHDPSLVLVQPSKTRPYITESLLMGREESNQSNMNSVSSKSYKLAYAPIEDSDQPARPRSLIRVFDGRIMGSQGSNVFSDGRLD